MFENSKAVEELTNCKKSKQNTKPRISSSKAMIPQF